MDAGEFIRIIFNRLAVETEQGSAAYILDLIEPERPRVDAAILKLISERTFAAADFIIRSDGVCRLSPQLARMVAALVA